MNTGLWNMASGLAAARRPGMTNTEATVGTNTYSSTSAGMSSGLTPLIASPP
jgi:hypothetical protein